MTVTSPGAPPAAPKQPPTNTWLTELLRRLHFYAGVFVGPFIVIASITGMLFAFAPNIENAAHRDLLTRPASANSVDLDAQIAAAAQHAGAMRTLASVSPAGTDTAITRVTFTDPALPEDQSVAVFVDPGTGEVTGETFVYGRGGTLPVTQWISTLHKDLHLGDIGAIYSEVAASWLAIVTIGGLWLLWRSRKARGMSNPRRFSRAAMRNVHTTTGVVAMIGLLAIAATGITWSQYAGTNVGTVREAAGWVSPRMSPMLSENAGAPGEHAEHEMQAPAQASETVSVAQVLQGARDAGIDANHVTLTAPTMPGAGWIVAEDERTTPIQMDKALIDPATGEAVRTTHFADYPFMGKVVTWGILLHRGELFGVVNQIALFAAAAAAITMTALGYAMWWKRRPSRGRWRNLGAPARGSLRAAPPAAAIAVVAVAVAVGLFLPTVGVMLVVFLAFDVLVASRNAPNADA